MSFCDLDIATSTPNSTLASRGLSITLAANSELGLRIFSFFALSGYWVKKITVAIGLKYVVVTGLSTYDAHTHAHTHTHTHKITPQVHRRN